MFDKVIEHTFHQAMSAQSLFNVALQAIPGVEFNWLEPFDVFRFEEHIPDSRFFLVNAERVTS